MTARRWAGALTVVVAAGLFQLTVDHPPEPEDRVSDAVAVTVPDLAGTPVRAATSELRDLGRREDAGDGLPVPQDLSSLERDVEPNGWVVAATTPAAGERWGPGGLLRVYALRADEWAWFTSHPVMPAVPGGIDGASVLSAGEPLHDVAGLVVSRYAAGGEPEWEPPRTSVGAPVVRVGSTVQAQTDLDLLSGRPVVTSPETAVTVATVPAAGSPLQVGQVLGVLVADRSQPATGGSGTGDGSGYSGGYSGGSSGGDDDFNVPGWACPTRWC